MLIPDIDDVSSCKTLSSDTFGKVWEERVMWPLSLDGGTRMLILVREGIRANAAATASPLAPDDDGDDDLVDDGGGGGGGIDRAPN